MQAQKPSGMLARAQQKIQFEESVQNTQQALAAIQTAQKQGVQITVPVVAPVIAQVAAPVAAPSAPALKAKALVKAPVAVAAPVVA